MILFHKKNNFHIIAFGDIEVAKKECEVLVEDYLKKMKY